MKREAEELAMHILHKGISDNNWSAVKAFIDRHPSVLDVGAEELEMGILYKAISDNNWSAAKAFIDRHPSVLDVEFVASTGETPLHVASKYGQVGIVKELVRLVPPEYLEIRNAYGCTPLAIVASHSGVIPIAICLVKQNSRALEIPSGNYLWNLPVTMAFRAGLYEMGLYLYSVTLCISSNHKTAMWVLPSSELVS